MKRLCGIRPSVASVPEGVRKDAGRVAGLSAGALSEIPSACGYGSMSDLCRDFKKRTGKTLREWRAVR